MVVDELTELLEPLLRRDPRLTATTAARRLVSWCAIEPEFEDRARRVAGKMRRALARARNPAVMVATDDHHRARAYIETEVVK